MQHARLGSRSHSTAPATAIGGIPTSRAAVVCSIATRATTLLVDRAVAVPHHASTAATQRASVASVGTSQPPATQPAHAAATAADTQPTRAAAALVSPRRTTAASALSPLAAASHGPVGCAAPRRATHEGSGRGPARAGGESSRRKRGGQATQATATPYVTSRHCVVEACRACVERLSGRGRAVVALQAGWARARGRRRRSGSGRLIAVTRATTCTAGDGGWRWRWNAVVANERRWQFVVAALDVYENSTTMPSSIGHLSRHYRTSRPGRRPGTAFRMSPI